MTLYIWYISVWSPIANCAFSASKPVHTASCVLWPLWLPIKQAHSGVALQNWRDILCQKAFPRWQTTSRATWGLSFVLRYTCSEHKSVRNLFFSCIAICRLLAASVSNNSFAAKCQGHWWQRRSIMLYWRHLSAGTNHACTCHILHTR